MGPSLQDFLCAFEPSDWVFPVAHSANCCVPVEPTSVLRVSRLSEKALASSRRECIEPLLGLLLDIDPLLALHLVTIPRHKSGKVRIAKAYARYLTANVVSAR